MASPNCSELSFHEGQMGAVTGGENTRKWPVNSLGSPSSDRAPARLLTTASLGTSRQTQVCSLRRWQRACLKSLTRPRDRLGFLFLGCLLPGTSAAVPGGLT